VLGWWFISLAAAGLMLPHVTRVGWSAGAAIALQAPMAAAHASGARLYLALMFYLAIYPMTVRSH
jgi:hypothetical protein